MNAINIRNVLGSVLKERSGHDTPSKAGKFGEGLVALIE
jgi:hypothetical protein